MKDIMVLDCTLRDGAHVVSGDFKHDCILNVISKLTEANTDIVEFGFLKMGDIYDPDKVYYPYIENAYAILDEVKPGDTCTDTDTPIYALMARADEYDINRLPPANGRIKLIRVAFYYDYLDGGIAFAKRVMELGYLCSLNLINTPGSTLDELNTFIDRANEIEPFAVSIVDTFGVFSLKELQTIVKVYDNRLASSIRIGLHVHENLSLAFALAQTFIGITGEGRKVIVDGSLMGIGRAPGNLCTELIADYLNSEYEKHISIHPIMIAIDRNIRPFKNKFKWGYAPEFFLSAKYKVHRSYAEYLNNCGVCLEKISMLLKLVDTEHAKKYDQRYIDQIVKENGLHESLDTGK